MRCGAALRLGDLREMNDDASAEALQDAIRHLHGVESSYIETVPIVETFQGKTAWEGDVKVFDLVGPADGPPASPRGRGEGPDLLCEAHAGRARARRSRGRSRG